MFYLNWPSHPFLSIRYSRDCIRAASSANYKRTWRVSPSKAFFFRSRTIDHLQLHHVQCTGTRFLIRDSRMCRRSNWIFIVLFFFSVLMIIRVSQLSDMFSCFDRVPDENNDYNNSLTIKTMSLEWIHHVNIDKLYLARCSIHTFKSIRTSIIAIDLSLYF